MYLEKGRLCPDNALFDVPNLAQPISAIKMAEKFPKFAKEMDGSSNECVLSWFYKKNKETKVYEFKDEELEQEAAELMEVEIKDFKESEEDGPENRPLTEQEINDFREHIADIRAIHSETKKQ